MKSLPPLMASYFALVSASITATSSPLLSPGGLCCHPYLTSHGVRGSGPWPVPLGQSQGAQGARGARGAQTEKRRPEQQARQRSLRPPEPRPLASRPETLTSLHVWSLPCGNVLSNGCDAYLMRSMSRRPAKAHAVCPGKAEMHVAWGHWARMQPCWAGRWDTHERFCV